MRKAIKVIVQFELTSPKPNDIGTVSTNEVNADNCLGLRFLGLSIRILLFLFLSQQMLS